VEATIEVGAVEVREEVAVELREEMGMAVCKGTAVEVREEPGMSLREEVDIEAEAI
jgi:hypothetical protein